MGRFSKNNNTPFPDALIQEARGLDSLRDIIEMHDIDIHIPQIFQVNQEVLEMTAIDQQGGSSSQWHQLGQALAQLHQIKQTQFGWPEGNYIGLNPQTNVHSDDWGWFFWQYRLKYQVSLIRDSDIQNRFNVILNQCQTQLVDWLNQNCSHASLIHGDLWNGNVLFDADAAWLIDPAVYCGDAEADLAMTELFGGFPAVFYQGYETVCPLSNQYPLKKVIYNLYHQLNHYNLFGSGYLGGCERAMDVIEKNFHPDN